MSIIKTYVDRLFEYKKPFNFDDIRQVETALREMGIGQGKDFWQTLQAINAAVKYNATRTGKAGYSLPNGVGLGRYLPMDATILTMTARAQSGYDRVTAEVGMNDVVIDHYRKFTTAMIQQYFDNCDATGHIKQPISQRCRQLKNYIDSVNMNYWQIARSVWRYLCDQMITSEVVDMPSVAYADSIMLSSKKFLFILTLIEAEACKYPYWNADTAYKAVRTVMDQQESEIDSLIEEIIALELERRNRRK